MACRCDTCKLDYFSCPGHFGHIEFPVAVVNPLLFGQVYALLRAKCFHCNQFKLSRLQVRGIRATVNGCRWRVLWRD
jgi:DNA-directed RNA polymerase I subunit RPA1